MNRLASLSLFGIALAVALAFGMPRRANSFVNDDCTNCCVIFAGNAGITSEEGAIGIDVDKDAAERDRGYERERTYDTTGVVPLVGKTAPADIGQESGAP